MGLSWCGLILLTLVSASLAETPAQLRAELRAIQEREAAKLAAMADDMTRQGAADDAQAVRSLIDPLPSGDGPTRFFPLPEVVPGPDAALPSRPVAALRPEVTAILKLSAEEFVALAARAHKSDRHAIAEDCLRAALQRQPEHAEARRLLGYVAHQGGWATPFAVDMLKKKKVDHAKYGWIDADWVPHLEQGELPGRVIAGRPERWLPAAEADAMRSEILRGWEIGTAHFAIRTNVPLDQAIAFGRRLEHFHEAFMALLADVIGPESPLARRYRGLAPTSVRPHQVWYFASKGEYVEYLRRLHGQGVDLELGRYDPPRKRNELGRSYFYRDDQGQIPITATLYHEASHQLLFESGVRSGYEANVGHYWVFEGLGTYFETLEIAPDGALQVGGFVGPRLTVARQRLIDRGELVPIDKLIGLNRGRFDGAGGGDVYLNYAEAMALTVFLMQAEGGRYRDGFLDYVADVYRGRFARGASGRSLEDRLGLPYDQLQDRFLDYLRRSQPEGH